MIFARRKPWMTDGEWFRIKRQSEGGFFFTALGIALGATAAAAFTTGAVVTGVAALAIGAAIAIPMMMGGSQPKIPGQPDVGGAPQLADAQAKAKEDQRARLLAANDAGGTHLTTPMGLTPTNANHPEIAKRWSKEYPNQGKLPMHKKGTVLNPKKKTVMSGK